MHEITKIHIKMKNQKDQFVSKILENLEKVNPEDWEGYILPEMMPSNIFTDNDYNGFNVMSLYIDCIINKHAFPYFGTFKNIRDAGGKLKKGSKGSPIMFYKKIFVHEKTNKRISEMIYHKLNSSEQQNFKAIPIVKNHYVFNIACIENLEELNLDLELVKKDNFTINEKCESFLNVMKEKTDLDLKIDELKTVASYNFVEDYISIPIKSIFKNEFSYYTTIFHEIIHWTGNEKRLDRKIVSYNKDKQRYSKEELIAEMGAMLMGLQHGYSNHIINSIRYLKSSINSRNKEMIFQEINEAFRESKRAKKYIENLIK